MKTTFRPMSLEHCEGIMNIYNWYIENSLAAYPETIKSNDYFSYFMNATKGYPAYTIFDSDEIVGFCFLRPYLPHSTFRETAEITYFIKENYTGKGLGKLALEKLEEGAKAAGIKYILASISSENLHSLSFHLKNDFRECGRFGKIITKNRKQFDIVWMQKNL
ncbi:MAG: N-acetyltransferase family protein [Bacteroidales bacterium]|jgi:phosphinothricin acetyltransferase|nr:N-acetyltransferase family protein [Bacteroidales bacterium]